jgi:predicted outer membrane protein
MKSNIPFFALCAVLASPGFAAQKKSRKRSDSTLPPTSPMLMLSAAPASTVEAMESNGLITTRLGGRDLDFFESLLVTGQLQVMLGELVKTRAESPQVKSVGGALASTQTQENEQINRLATLNGLTLSAAATGAQRQTSAELEKLTGSSFDIACVTRIVEANEQTVRAYEEGSESGNPEIHTFSEQMLPIARERLRIAKMMIQGPEKPAQGAASPAPRNEPIKLRPGVPSLKKQPATPPPSTPPPAKEAEQASPKEERGHVPLNLEVAPPAPPPLTGGSPYAPPAATPSTPVPPGDSSKQP